MSGQDGRQTYDSLARGLDSLLEQIHDERMGFALLVFPFDSPAVANYLSNAERADMVTAMREAADRLERQEDNPK